MADLDALIARLREAKEPITDNKDVEWCILHSPWYYTHDAGPLWDNFVRALRGSVDAALALVGQVLPGWEVSMHTCDPDSSYLDPKQPSAEVWEPYDPKRSTTGISANGATLDIAILIAMLEAMKARDHG